MSDEDKWWIGIGVPLLDVLVDVVEDYLQPPPFLKQIKQIRAAFESKQCPCYTAAYTYSYNTQPTSLEGFDSNCYQPCFALYYFNKHWKLPDYCCVQSTIDKICGACQERQAPDCPHTKFEAPDWNPIGRARTVAHLLKDHPSCSSARHKVSLPPTRSPFSSRLGLPGSTLLHDQIE